MSQLDINVFVGSYPFRDIGRWDESLLLESLAAAGSNAAWVSNLSAVFWRDPAAGNDALYELQSRHEVLRAVPAIHPGLPGWQEALDVAVAHGVPAVRCDPTWYGIAPAGPDACALLAACAARAVPLQMSVRLEDIRQRHPNDTVADLPPWAVRQLIRAVPAGRIVVTHADREFVEQVHFGSTPDEAKRVLWDISCIWGPPEDHLELLLGTVGINRFAFGTGTPLRLWEAAVARLDLLDLAPAAREQITWENARAFAGR